jgi:hypothetical protein
MATKYIYLSGKGKWIKAHKPDAEYNNYTMQLYPNEASMKVFNESGLSLAPKSDADGTYITFRRPETKLIKDEVVKFGPPSVFGVDGKPFDGLIGNGSEVTIKVSVFDTRKGPGHRWEGVKVDKLVEYVPANATAVAATGNAAPALPF